jgi:hypothetical protein
MGRYIRNTAILAKIETTEGVDATPTGSSNAILVSDMSINPLNAQNVDRALVRSYFGASEQLVGTAYKTVEFTAELASSGSAGAVPAWGALMRACGFAENDDTTFVSYSPDSPSAQKSATVYYYDDGVLHKLLGCKGTLTIGMGVGERPTLQFSFIGLDGGDTSVSNPSTDYAAWKQPLVITNPNTGNVTFGGTYSAGAVTGGTSYTSRGLQIDVGNNVQFTPMLGAEFVDITQREVTGRIELDLSASQEATFMGNVKSNALSSVSLEHGTAAGGIVGIFMAAVQLINPSKVDANGRRLIGFDMRSVPAAGNDDLVIYAK